MLHVVFCIPFNRTIRIGDVEIPEKVTHNQAHLNIGQTDPPLSDAAPSMKLCRNCNVLFPNTSSRTQREWPGCQSLISLVLWIFQPAFGDKHVWISEVVWIMVSAPGTHRDRCLSSSIRNFSDSHESCEESVCSPLQGLASHQSHRLLAESPAGIQ